MKTISKAFIAAFAFIGLLALAAAIFAGAWWQIPTAGLCAMMVLIGVADIRRCKKQEKS